MERIFFETEMLSKESSPTLSKQTETEEIFTILPAHTPHIKGGQPTPKAFGTYIKAGSLFRFCLRSKKSKISIKI